MRMPKAVKVVPQRKEWDCGVAALVSLSGKSYGDVSQMVRELIDDPRLKTRGLMLWQMEQVAFALGIPVRRVYRSRGYLENATGILGLVGGTCDPYGHWVVMKGGVLLDPTNAEAWTVSDYLKAGKCRTGTLLVPTHS